MNGILALIFGVMLFSPVVVSAADRNSSPDSSVTSAIKVSPQKLDLNLATPEDLVGVPGIGPRMAQAIVELRAKKGSFNKFEDLLEVTGIKEKKLAALAVYLEVLPLQPTSTTKTPVQTR